MCIHCEMISTLKLIDIFITSLSYFFFFYDETLKVNPQQISSVQHSIVSYIPREFMSSRVTTIQGVVPYFLYYCLFDHAVWWLSAWAWRQTAQILIVILSFPSVEILYTCILSVSLFLPSKYESYSCSVVSDSLRPHGLYSPWDSPGHNTGMDSHSLL